MLNIAIGLYMIMSTVTGTTQTLPPVTATSTPPETPVQTLEDKKETRIKNSVEVEAYVKEYFKDVPILAEVARCESQFRQTDKEGNIIRGVQNRFDVGVMQINELYHRDEAKAQNIDIYSLDGNLKYARELYEKQGVYPWMASSACWSGASKEIAQK